MVLFKRFFVAGALSLFVGTGLSSASDFGKPVTWDKYSLSIDGRRVCPVMGEIHYSRIPADEWPEEVRKMKEGGVTLIATYVFWNHSRKASSAGTDSATCDASSRYARRSRCPWCCV